MRSRPRSLVAFAIVALLLGGAFALDQCTTPSGIRLGGQNGTQLSGQTAAFADGVTITGAGTQASPFVAVGAAQTAFFFNVKSYGALGNGVADDRAAIESAISAAQAAGGGIVFFPNGTYALTEHNTSQRCLSLPSNVYLMGQSWAAMLQLKAGVTVSHNVVLIKVAASSTNTAVTNLTLDGNYPTNTDVNFHNDAVFIDTAAGRVTVIGNQIQNFDGTGVNPNIQAFQVLIERNYVHDMHWSGVSIGDASNQHNITIRGDYFTNVVEAVHIEITAGSDNIIVEDSYLGTVQVGNAAISIAGGPTPSTYATNVIVRNCQIAGYINISNASNVLIEGNNIISSDVAPTTPHQAVRIVNEGANINVRNNSITITAASNGTAAVGIAGNPSGDTLSNVNIVDNDIFVQGPTQDGVYLQTMIDARVQDNRVIYTGVSAPSGYGLHVYNKTNRVINRVRFDGNRVVDFATGLRIDALVNGPSYRINNLMIRHNTFETSAWTMANALDLNPTSDGTYPGGNSAVLAIDMVDNLTATGINPVNTLPAIPTLVSGNHDGIADYRGTGVPTFAATKGSTFRRTDGGAGTSFYVNESGGTTWTAK